VTKHLRHLVLVSLSVAISTLVFTSVWADFARQEWAFFKPISLPEEHIHESLIEIVPDFEIFATANAELTDLRIIAANDQTEIPYKLIVERGERSRSELTVAVSNLGHMSGQYTSFVADLKETGILHNELEVQTPSKNFQRIVRVEAGTDGETWMILEKNAQIFDHTLNERNYTVRDTRIHYPSTTSRYLRIRILDNDEPPIEIVGAVAYFTQELEAQEIDLYATMATREEDTASQSTILVVDLKSTGVPSARLAIITPQENFYRQVGLEGSNDGVKWKWIQSSDVLYAYNTPRFVGNKLSVTYPESTFRYFRLTIRNEDNPPIEIEEIRAHGFLRKLVFSASPAGIYRLYYGNPSIHAPSYDLERIFPYLVTENLTRAQLGPHTTNPIYIVPSRPFTERYPWLLPMVVAGAAFLIGLFLLKLLSQIRRQLSPPTP
jgi:hypothetical protein